MRGDKRTYITWIVCGIIPLFLYTKVNAQSDGLVFASHEVVSDLRTSLNLTDKKSLCFNDDFEVSFEFAFPPGYSDYFGYVFRFVKDEQVNIDLIYDFRLTGSTFKVILGNRVSSIHFAIDSSRLFQSWATLRLRFNKERDELTLVTPDGNYTEKNIGFKGNHCFKMVFGVNHDERVKTLDLPPMKIRNIKISERNKLKYHWPLDEENGPLASEVINHHNAQVENPHWIRNEHSNWKTVRQVTVSGPASAAFNPETETVCLVGADSLYQYSVPKNEVSGQPYGGQRQDLLPGNQSLFVPRQNRLYNIYPDQKLVASFDFKSRSWDQPYAQTPITDFWHTNKFYSAADTSIYIIGGYGHFNYKNRVHRYHLPTGVWEEISVTGDRLVPRYLAALGVNGTGDSAYILGGFGSVSGQQIVNPQNLYDLVLLDVKNRSFKKLYNLKAGEQGFAFANSLVLDAKDNSYYALIYPNDKYNSELQLIRGSLTDSSFTAVGNKVPYHFHDIYSFADLFFCPRSEKFVAVVLNRKEGETVATIFTLASPPVPVAQPATKAPTRFPYLPLVAAGLVLAAGAVLYQRYRRRKKEELRPDPKEEVVVPPAPVAPAIAEAPTVAYPAAEARPPAEAAPQSAIFLFGDMQVYDPKEEEITRYFTPLLKELFLIILLYTIRRGRGISSEKLTEILWYDKDEKSARNNRSVNIAKLKNILERLEDCQVVKSGDYWKIAIDFAKTRVDYVHYLSIVREKNALSKQKIMALTRIVQRGSFLSNTEYQWLDSFKSEISNEVIDTYLQFAGQMKISDDPEFLVQIANYIFYFDPVNEEAMVLKCKALAYLGKHSLAQQAFQSFAREYKSIYGEAFSRDLHDVLGQTT